MRRIDTRLSRSGVAVTQFPHFFRRSGRRLSSGFTLIELVVALTVVAIIVGFSIPVMKGIDREKIAREPVTHLVNLVREVRTRAISEGRPYQIAFENGRFVATRFSVAVADKEGLTTYLKDLEEEEKRLQEQIKINEWKRAAVKKEGQGEEEPVLDEAAVVPLPFSKVDPWPEDVVVEALFWGDEEWQPIENQFYRRWVFQPSGLCNPLRLRVNRDIAWFEVRFSGLTGEIEHEKSFISPPEPR